MLFALIAVVTVVAFLGAGVSLSYRPVTQKSLDPAQAKRIRTTFMLQQRTEPKPEPEPKSVPEKKVKKAKPEPEKEVVDLTQKPKLDQSHEDIKKPDSKKKKRKKVRRVYGVKKIYSKGIGSGGSAADAVVGKYGNTLKKDVDTVTATEEQLKGELASVTTVTSAPRVKKKPRISYTEQMREHKVEGVIKARVLVDIDGTVKKISLLNDLGHGSAQQAVSVCRQMEFVPAKRGNEPVATWIIIPIRFELLST